MDIKTKLELMLMNEYEVCQHKEEKANNMVVLIPIKLDTNLKGIFIHLLTALKVYHRIVV